MPTFITRKPIASLGSTGSEFGRRVRPEPEASDQHRGIDFPVPSGTEIFAAHSGTVVKTGTAKGLGNVLVIKDASGKGTLYAHLTNLLTVIDLETGEEREIRKGDVLVDGQKVALSGNTGAASTGPHLHFEVLGVSAVSSIESFGTQTSLGIDSTASRENPRLHLAQAFSSEFSYEVQSGKFGIELTGDERDNTILGNRNSNSMSGLGGRDVYSFPELTDTDEVIDSDNDGRIKIGSKFLEGDAKPKKNPDGSVAEGQWTLEGYDLVRSGANLVIVKAGNDVSSADTPRITIQNFPFDSLDLKWGINLGREKGDLGASTQVSDPETFASVVFASTDKRGRFFAPVEIRNGDTYNYAIRTYDQFGFPVRTSLLTSNSNSFSDDGAGTSQGLFTGGQCKRLANGNVAFIYAIDDVTYRAGGAFKEAKSSAHLAIVNPKGEVISNQLISEEVSTNRATYLSNFCTPNFVQTAADGKNYMCFVRGGNRFFCGEFSSTGDLIGTFEQESDLSRFSGTDESYARATLPTKSQVVGSHLGFSVTTPTYRAPIADEIRPNYTPAAGTHELNVDEPEVLLTFSHDAATNLALTPTPNSRVAISGFAESPGSQINLGRFGLSAEELTARTFTVSGSDYTLDDLLAGKFVTPTGGRRLQASASPSAATDDDFYDEPLPADEVAALLAADEAPKFTVITLPNNQTLIFTGVEARNLTENIGTYFSFVAPSLEPSPLPSADPTADPTISGTGTSTARPTTAATLSGTGTARPTAERTPSMTGSALPSAERTPSSSGLPTRERTPSVTGTGLPTDEPTPDSTILPSWEPSALPSVYPTNATSWPPSPYASFDPSRLPTLPPSFRPTPYQSPSLLPPLADSRDSVAAIGGGVGAALGVFALGVAAYIARRLRRRAPVAPLPQQPAAAGEAHHVEIATADEEAAASQQAATEDKTALDAVPTPRRDAASPTAEQLAGISRFTGRD